MATTKRDVPDIAISGKDLEDAFKGFALLRKLEVSVNLLSYPHNRWCVDLLILPIYPSWNIDRIFFTTGAVPISLAILNVFLRLEDIAKQYQNGVEWDAIV